MSAEVHRLTGAGASLGPQPKLVAELKRLLKSAERGELKGFGYFTVNANDSTTSHWIPGCARAHDMVAAVSRLQFRMLASDVGQGKDDP